MIIELLPQILDHSFLCFFLGTSLALRLKDIDVPPHRVVGEKARLVCKFDMEGDILYSVKWYKDDLEFYRFVPNDRPKLQVFPQKGIHVDVSSFIASDQAPPTGAVLF